MHVTVCLCTYLRPEPLRAALAGAAGQQAGDAFTFSIVVADNDARSSARPVVREFAAESAVAIDYCCEPQRNIALARNRALRHARGEYAAFLDDDEVPAPDWLRQLVAVAESRGADAVFGPVRPAFASPPPPWLVRGRFCERPEYPTGATMHWSRCWAGNSLVRRAALEGIDGPFRASFAQSGEDVDLFRRLAQQGRRLIWCSEAVVHEVVPPARWKKTYWLKRALVQGRSSSEFATPGAIATSCVALPAYSLALPLALLGGPHVFLHCAIRLCGHSARLLGTFGISLVKERPL